MTGTKPTFVDLCLQGRALVIDIDDFVDRWHDGDDDRSLAESIGLTESEYALWVARPHALNSIISARKNDALPVIKPDRV